jgi:hypothetical protein
VTPNGELQAASHPLGPSAFLSTPANIDHHAEIGKRQKREKDDVGSAHTLDTTFGYHSTPVMPVIPQ